MVSLRGMESYFYMAKSGILKRWADKYGVVIKVQRFDYAASLDAFVAKNIDACTMTNMEALDMPAAAGVDSTVVLVGTTQTAMMLCWRAIISPWRQLPASRFCWFRRPSQSICWNAQWC